MTWTAAAVLVPWLLAACPYDCGGPSCRHRPTVTRRRPDYLARLHYRARLRYRSATCRRLP